MCTLGTKMGQTYSWFGSTPDNNMMDVIESDLMLHGFTAKRDLDTLFIEKGSLRGEIKCFKVVRLMGSCTHYCSLSLHGNEEQVYTSHQKLMRDLMTAQQDIV